MRTSCEQKEMERYKILLLLKIKHSYSLIIYAVFLITHSPMLEMLHQIRMRGVFSSPSWTMVIMTHHQKIPLLLYGA